MSSFAACKVGRRTQHAFHTHLDTTLHLPVRVMSLPSDTGKAFLFHAVNKALGNTCLCRVTNGRGSGPAVILQSFDSYKNYIHGMTDAVGMRPVVLKPCNAFTSSTLSQRQSESSDRV